MDGKINKYFGLLFLVFILALGACASADSEGFYDPVHYTDLGVIESVGGGGVNGYHFRMMRDDGVRLTAVDNYSKDYELFVGKRVYCSYEIVDTFERPDGSKECDIVALGFDDILSKPAIRRSFIEKDPEHRTDSIGNDLISVIQGRAWLGGDHINIEFVYKRAKGGSEKHLINLVWDDMTPEADAKVDGIVNLSLHHNAGGVTEKEGYVMEDAAGFVSFPILETVPPASNEVIIRLHYNWNGADSSLSENYIETSFKPGSSGSTPVIIGNTGENIVVAPPDAALYLE